MRDWLPLLVGLVSAGSVIGGVLITQHYQTRNTERSLAHQREQERLKDARALRDATRERLRAFYIDALNTAYASAAVMEEIGSPPPPGENWEVRQGRLESFLQDVKGDVNRSLVKLRLETQTGEILRLSRDINTGFHTVVQGINEYRQAPNSEKLNTLKNHREQVWSMIDRLEELAKAHLEKLNQPL